tara:strand:+ start:1652 stop:1951 length:300 start_codon:yes stop_codon:yes gene_type:complete
MTDKKELWLGEIPLFTEHEKHEGAIKEPHRRQVLAGYKTRRFTVRQQLIVRRRTKHFKPFHTPHLDRKVRSIYPRGKVFYRMALLAYSPNKIESESQDG